MQEIITVDENTRLKEILDAYPWLPDELVRRDERFKRIKSPLAKPMINHFTVADAARYAGYPAEELLRQFHQLVAQREE